MEYMEAFKKEQNLISKIGEGNAHLVWALSLYLDITDREDLAAKSLTDGSDDKKIDFIMLDYDLRKIVLAQGYYSSRSVDKAPSNKASDLNTAIAWLISADEKMIPERLKLIIKECRKAIKNEIEQIELLYVHNLPESINVQQELTTTGQHLANVLNQDYPVVVYSKEIGYESINRLYSLKETQIRVKDKINFPYEILHEVVSNDWSSGVCVISGKWLKELFDKYNDELFSVNYRGFLGIQKSRSINNGIRQSAETEPKNFFAYNNGVTLLTMGIKTELGTRYLDGISIINGAQTTGSIGNVEVSHHSLPEIKILCKIITCSNKERIESIVKYNNTQNDITTWDQYSNNTEQQRIALEFKQIGHNYSFKRGFKVNDSDISIEKVIIPVLAFNGLYKDAGRSRSAVFEKRYLYKAAFENKKARHILLAYTAAKAIDEIKLQIKYRAEIEKKEITDIESKMLEFSNSLDFKPYLTALVANCLESIVGFRVDKGQISFSPDAARKPIESLTSLWSPIIDMIFNTLASVTDMNIADLWKDENSLDEVTKKISALLVIAGKTTAKESFGGFKFLVTKD